ncbi:chemotaxis protein CheB [Dyella sp. GSA-30]|uniref:chemotaxis protein CheB n=1 Tax=Dyella sp. GSA-30 TaxID=2994496 RepID=UPI0024909307|nr:chemotaxis protein CheB [Dyella sp. GSA-30]BDU20388.1 hypothetical protein DYGSA30_18450 [Dyella sp. GSA-30]
MSEAATAVALLFDDAELGGHLRDALRERGAQIVHEGTLATLSREALQGSGAEVVVVNLDDQAVEVMDHLYDVIDSDRPRVVFNDAQASRGLDGWDRARWARHLAAKVMSLVDLDPPRPADAPAFVPPPSASAEPEIVAAPAPVLSVVQDVVDTAPIEAPIEMPAHEETVVDVADDLPLIDDAPLEFASDGEIPEESIEASETLAAELEALLAADEQHVVEDEFGSGLNYDAGDELALHDGDFAATPLDEPEFEPVAIEQQPTQAPEAPAVARPAFQLDHLSLAPLDENFAPVLANKVATADAPAFGQSSTWSLIDEDTPVAAVEQAKSSSAEFGIEKLSAADYLAPDAGDHNEHDLQPGLSLELVSMEAAIAPQQREDHEVMLGELDSAIARVLLLGASADSTDAVCEFLRALPKGLRLTVLHTQHHAFDAADALAQRLKDHTSMPVRVAGRDNRTRAGEILFVPAGQQVRLLRDGRIESHVVDGAAPQQPSIDASFTTAAGVFGRDAIAIVFAGNATDAVAGAQAVYDRGGQVWVESAPGDHYAGMVRGIEAERLVSFSGTPQELAARLTEQFA